LLTRTPTYIPQLLANNSPGVIMPQEAGANPPATAAVQPNPTGDGRVAYYLWNRGDPHPDR